MAHMTIGLDLVIAAFTALYLAKLLFVDVLGAASLGSASLGSGSNGLLGIREKRSLLNQHIAQRC